MDVYSYRMIYEHNGKEECWFIDAVGLDDAIEQMYKEHKRKPSELIESEKI